MSEAKKEKTIQELHQEYSRLCANAGQVQYQISALSDDLRLINEQLKDINLEAAAKAKTDSEKKEAETTKPVEEKASE